MMLDHTIPPFAANERRVINGREYINVHVATSKLDTYLSCVHLQAELEWGPVDHAPNPHCMRCVIYDDPQRLRTHTPCDQQCSTLTWKCSAAQWPKGFWRIVRTDDLPAMALMGVLE